MRNRIFAAAVVAGALMFSVSSTACTRAANVTAAQDDQEQHAKQRAVSLFSEFSSGKLDRSDFTPEMDKALTPELLKQVSPEFTTLGSIQSLTLSSKEDIQGGTRYVFLAAFTGGDHKIMIFLTKDNKVGGYRVLP